MSNFNHTADISGGGYGGMGGFGGGWLLGGLIIFLLIFKDGFLGHRGGHDERGHGGGDRGRERNWFPDESNFQQSRELDNHMCMIEKVINARADKADGIITQNVIQDLRDKNAEKDAIINRQHSEAFTLALFGQLKGDIAALACGLPKAPPFFADVRTNCTAPMPRCDEPRRGGCGLD